MLLQAADSRQLARQRRVWQKPRGELNELQEQLSVLHGLASSQDPFQVWLAHRVGLAMRKNGVDEEIHTASVHPVIRRDQDGRAFILDGQLRRSALAFVHGGPLQALRAWRLRNGFLGEPQCLNLGHDLVQHLRVLVQDGINELSLRLLLAFGGAQLQVFRLLFPSKLPLGRHSCGGSARSLASAIKGVKPPLISKQVQGVWTLEQREE